MPQNGLGLRRFGDKQPHISPISSPELDDAPAPVSAFIQPVADEADIVFGSVETTVVSAQPVSVFMETGWDRDGELVPYEGAFTAADGARFLHGVPAFVFESRPVSRIQ